MEGNHSLTLPLEMGGCSVTLQQHVKNFSLRLRILRLLDRLRMRGEGSPSARRAAAGSERGALGFANQPKRKEIHYSLR